LKGNSFKASASKIKNSQLGETQIKAKRGLTFPKRLTEEKMQASEMYNYMYGCPALSRTRLTIYFQKILFSNGKLM